DLVASAAAQASISLDSDVVLRNATDGLYAVKAGYPSAMLGSYADHGAPANYHWPSDTTENVDYRSLADAVEICERVIRRLDVSWLEMPSGRALDAPVPALRTKQRAVTETRHDVAEARRSMSQMSGVHQRVAEQAQTALSRDECDVAACRTAGS